MNVLIKTLAGDIFSVTYPLNMTEADLPFLVHAALQARNLLEDTPVHYLRLIPEEDEGGEDKDKDGKDKDGKVKEGKVFYLFVEDPQLEVRIYLEDKAALMIEEDQEQGHEDQEQEDDEWIQPYERESQETEVYLLRVLHQENILFQHLFYTPVAHVGPVDRPYKRYSNVYYHEDCIDVVYNPSAEARIQGVGQFRDVELRGGSTAHYLPSAFALTCPVPAYASVIGKEIDRVWMEHVQKTGEPHLYPVQRLYSRPDLW